MKIILTRLEARQLAFALGLATTIGKQHYIRYFKLGMKVDKQILRQESKKLKRRKK